jgi:hypothetical protein
MVYAWFATHPWMTAAASLASGFATGVVLERSVPMGMRPTVSDRPATTSGAYLASFANKLKDTGGFWLPLVETAALGSATRAVVVGIAKSVGLMHKNYDPHGFSRFEPFLLTPIAASLSGDPSSLYIAAGSLAGTTVVYLLQILFPQVSFSEYRLEPQCELPFAFAMYATLFGVRFLSKHDRQKPASPFDLRNVHWSPVVSGIAIGVLHFVSVLVTGHPINLVRPILHFLSPTVKEHRVFMSTHRYASLGLLGAALGAYVSSVFNGTRVLRRQRSSARKLSLEDRIALGSLGLVGFLIVRFIL